MFNVVMLEHGFGKALGAESLVHPAIFCFVRESSYFFEIVEADWLWSSLFGVLGEMFKGVDDVLHVLGDGFDAFRAASFFFSFGEDLELFGVVDGEFDEFLSLS